MKDFALKFALISLLAVAVGGTPVALHAQTTNRVLPGLITINKNLFPFHGKLTALDTNANTITFKSQTIQITTNTIVTRQGKRVTLADGAPGETVAGTYKKEADGKLNALDLRFAPKHLTQPRESKTNATIQATTP